MNKEELIYIQEANQRMLDDLLPHIQKIKRLETRAKKIELVLTPRFDLIVFRDKKTNHQYLQAKVYWPDTNGKVKRLLSFSLGNLINYPNGKKDPITINAAREEISSILMKKFGVLI